MLLLLSSDMLLLQHLLLVALLVAPLGGAPAAPAPSPAGVEEEGGRQAAEEAKLRLPGSIVAPLTRAELFQRPRPRYVWLQLWCRHCSLVSCTYDGAVSDPKPPDAGFGNDTVITLGLNLFVNSDIRALEIRASGLTNC